MCGWAAQEEEPLILSIVPWLKDPVQLVIVPLPEIHKAGSIFTCLSTPRGTTMGSYDLIQISWGVGFASAWFKLSLKTATDLFSVVFSASPFYKGTLKNT